jgi:poly [ADP-ribose] polymerase
MAWMRKPPFFKTSEMVKAKLQMLEALVTLKMLSSVEDEGLHPMDRTYKQLDVNMDINCKKRKMVEHSTQSTHASTHSMYSMDMLEVFSLDKTNETAMYEDCGNTCSCAGDGED